MLNNYDRFGPLCPGEFLQKWWRDDKDNGKDKNGNERPKGGWWYPGDDPALKYEGKANEGFEIDNTGRPIYGNVTLKVGMLIDRFGSEGGDFVSPLGAPYEQRAIPPSNLNAASGP